jgi:glutamate--cysteine ligase
VVCIEYSSPPLANLFLLEKRVIYVLENIIDCLNDHSFYLFGGGISPYVFPASSLSLNIDRYYFLAEETDHHFVPRDVGRDFLAFLLTSHNSPHVDISSKEAVSAFSVLNALSGLQVALTANSCIWKGKPDSEYRCIRSRFYEEMYPHRKNFLTMPSDFPESQEDYISYFLKAPPFLVQRNGETMRVLGCDTLAEYFQSEHLYSKDSGGNIVQIQPSMEDIIFNERLLWTNARLRASFGTLESRCSCQQPPREFMCIAALVMGVICNIQEAKELASSKTPNNWRNIHNLAIKKGMSMMKENLIERVLLQRFLELSEQGLLKRGFGEEKFLSPLFERLRTGKGPADIMVDYYSLGGLQAVLNHFIYRIPV